jgi:AraC-like DNA-binding protein
MPVLVRPPSPILAPFVERLGFFSEDVSAGWQRTIPTGTMHLLVNLAEDEFRWRSDDGEERAEPGCVLSAASANAFSISLAGWQAVVFVCFRPGGAYPFITRPASSLNAPLVDLGTLWGRSGTTLRQRLQAAPTVKERLRLVEKALLDHAVRPLEPDPIVVSAVPELDRGVAVSQVIGRLGLSHSTLLRRFNTQVGLTPKVFARVRRLQRLLVSTANNTRDVDWARTAAEFGYFDQAHLIKEFQMLTGATPSVFELRRADPHDPELALC